MDTLLCCYWRWCYHRIRCYLTAVPSHRRWQCVLKTKQNKTIVSIVQQIGELHRYLINKICQNILTNSSSIAGNQLVTCDFHRDLFVFFSHHFRIIIFEYTYRISYNMHRALNKRPTIVTPWNEKSGHNFIVAKLKCIMNNSTSYEEMKVTSLNI